MILKFTAMGFNFGFFGTQEHRVFNYKPRFYDVEKEALKEKFGHVDGSMSGENYTPGSYIKGSLRDGHYQKSKEVGKVQKIVGFVALVFFFVVLILIVRFYSLLW